jgi:hypothetical protein
MSPGDAWSDGRLDELAAQVRVFAAMTAQVATHEAKIDGLTDDVRMDRKIRDENIVRFERLIRDVRDENRAAVEKWSDACDAKIEKLAKRMDEQAAARQWTLASKLTLFGVLFGPLFTSLVLVLMKGH